MIKLSDIVSKYVYKNQEGYKISPRIDELYRMLDEIIATENISIEDYIYIMPLFYFQFKDDTWHRYEYDEGHFYIEFGNNMSESDYQRWLIPKSPITPLFVSLFNEERKILKPNFIQTPEDLIEAIKKYKEYLPRLLEKLYENSIIIGSIDTNEKKATGYFRFEIYGE